MDGIFENPRVNGTLKVNDDGSPRTLRQRGQYFVKAIHDSFEAEGLDRQGKPRNEPEALPQSDVKTGDIPS